MSRSQLIGFTQRIELDWLEYAAQAYASGASRREIVQGLQGVLGSTESPRKVAGQESREKTIGILLKCWVTVPTDLRPLRDRAAELLYALPASDHLALHWGMCSTVYPFVSRVAETIGRLLLLQGEAPAAQVQRRLCELLGERETVSRAVQYLIRMLADWGVLHETAHRSVYVRGRTQHIERADLAAWLVEAGLLATGAPVAVSSLGRWPMLFPFDITVSPGRMVSRSSNLTLLQYEGGSPALAVRAAP